MFFLAQQSFGSFWSLVASSGPIAQAVLVVLLIFSVASWTIIGKKVRFYREVNDQSQEFYGLFRKTASLSQLYGDCQRYPKSPLAGMFKSGYEELNHQIKAADPSAGAPEVSPSAGALKSFNGLQRTRQKSAQTEMTTL